MRKRSAGAATAVWLLTSLSALSPAFGIGNPDTRPSAVGGGWVGVGNPNEKVHIHVGLACPSEAGVDPTNPHKPRLELRGRSSTFSLDRMVSAFCQNNLHHGSGVGTCNGVGGFIVNWRLTDGGLGGPDTREDRVEIRIDDPSETCSVDLAGPLEGGNINIRQ